MPALPSISSATVLSPKARRSTFARLTLPKAPSLPVTRKPLGEALIVYAVLLPLNCAVSMPGPPSMLPALATCRRSAPVVPVSRSSLAAVAAPEPSSAPRMMLAMISFGVAFGDCWNSRAASPAT
jgi:hypothetical protein